MTMSNLVEVKVPDIGDFSDVPVIDLFVKVGDAIKVDDAIATLESDKATMDVPSTVAGTVKEVLIQLGSRVSEGAVLIKVEAGAANATVSPAKEATTESAPAAPVAAPAAATLGGVCLTVGCIPSKALLHVAAVMEEAQHASDLGVTFAAPTVDIDKLRAHKDKVVGKLTGGLAGMAKGRKVEVVRGYGSFLDPHHIEVEVTDGTAQDKTGTKKVIKFAKCIIAAGSAAVHLPLIPKDPRTVYSTLGARVDVVEMLDGLMQGPDRDAVKVWEKQNLHRFDKVMLKTKTVAVEAKDDGLYVKFEGEGAPSEVVKYDMILQAAGRAPNGKKIGADKAGVAVTDRGFINVDAQMRTNVPHIFAIGDLVGQPMLAHKAVHEAHVAAEVAAGHKAAFDGTG